MMPKKILAFGLLTASCIAWGASVPRGSTYDSRMQSVAYNSQNTTVVHARTGYVTTLLFDDDEEVIDTQTGFAKGWTVSKRDNRVTVSPNPITQPVTDASGNSINQVFPPTARDWKTNLFVVTARHYYSMELNVLEQDAPSLAFLIRYHYPNEERLKSAATNASRQKILQEAQEKQQIATAFGQVTTPRNWRYTKRVAAGSVSIAPDFTYDDGRFTYLGFSSIKTLPSPFLVINQREQVVTPRIFRDGNYTVMVVQALSPSLVLRYGSAVVGIENAAFWNRPLSGGNTISPAVTLEAK